MKYCLFTGRHPIPGDPPAILSSFDFNSFKAIKSEHYEKFLEDLKKGSVSLYVTGLTPGLTQILSETGRNKNLNLLHFNSVTKEYVSQLFSG